MKYLIIAISMLFPALTFAATIICSPNQLPAGAVTGLREQLSSGGYGFCQALTCNPTQGYDAVPVRGKCVSLPKVSWFSKNQSLVESEATVVLRAQLSRALSVAHEVGIQTAGSIGNNTDFEVPTTVKFSAGQTMSDPFSIKIHKKANYQSDRVISLGLIGQSTPSITVTIKDSETAVPTTYSISSQTVAAGQTSLIAVNFSQPQSSLFPTRITLAAGSLKASGYLPAKSTSAMISLAIPASAPAQVLSLSIAGFTGTPGSLTVTASTPVTHKLSIFGSDQGGYLSCSNDAGMIGSMAAFTLQDFDVDVAQGQVVCGWQGDENSTNYHIAYYYVVDSAGLVGRFGHGQANFILENFNRDMSVHAVLTSVYADLHFITVKGPAHGTISYADPDSGQTVSLGAGQDALLPAGIGGQSVELYYEPADGYELVHFDINGNYEPSNPVSISLANNSGEAAYQIEAVVALPAQPVNFTATISGNGAGSVNINVNGTGLYGNTAQAQTNDLITYDAIANCITCTFLGWYENGERVSESNPYEFTAVSDRFLTAMWSEDTTVNYSYSGTVEGNPSAYVSIYGQSTEQGPALVPAGIDFFVQVQNTDPNFEFVEWQENGQRISQDEIMLVFAESNRSFTAVYRIKTRTVLIPAPTEGQLGVFVLDRFGNITYNDTLNPDVPELAINVDVSADASITLIWSQSGYAATFTRFDYAGAETPAYFSSDTSAGVKLTGLEVIGTATLKVITTAD